MDLEVLLASTSGKLGAIESVLQGLLEHSSGKDLPEVILKNTDYAFEAPVREKGFVRPISKNGMLAFEVGIPFSVEDDDEMKLATIVEELTHLAHYLANQSLQEDAEKALEANELISSSPMSAGEINKLFSLYDNRFYKDLKQHIDELAENHGVDTQVSLKGVILDYFESSIGLCGYLQWFDEAFPNNDFSGLLAPVKQLEDWRKDKKARFEAAVDTDRQQAIQIHNETAPQNLRDAVLNAKRKLLEFINSCRESELHKIANDLGLRFLLLIERYKSIKKAIDDLEDEEAQNRVMARLESLTDVEISVAFSAVMTADEIDESQTRAQMVLKIKERLTDDKAKSILKELINQQLLNPYIKGRARAALTALPDFWDISEENPAHLSPAYYERNMQAILAYVEGREAELLNMDQAEIANTSHYSSISLGSGSISRLQTNDIPTVLGSTVIDGITKQVWGENSRYAFHEYDTSRRSIATKQIKEAISLVRYLLNEGFNLYVILEGLPGLIKAANEVTAFKTQKTILMEVLAAGVQSYLGLKEKQLGAAGYNIALAAVDENGVSVWYPTIQAIAKYLKQQPDELKKLLQAENLAEVQAIVGLEN